MLLKNNELVQRRGIEAILMPEAVIADFKSTTNVAPTLSFEIFKKSYSILNF